MYSSVKFLIFIILLSFSSCTDENRSNQENLQEKKDDVKAKVDYPNFNSLRDIFNYTQDYHEENGTLKIISDVKPYKVQISKQVFKEDGSQIINEIAKRDLVYVAYQIFSLTNISEVEITSIPLSHGSKILYLKDYEKTKTISRENAKSVMMKNIGIDDFKLIWDLESGLVLPNTKFNQMKFDKLDQVYSEL